MLQAASASCEKKSFSPLSSVFVPLLQDGTQFFYFLASCFWKDPFFMLTPEISSHFSDRWWWYIWYSFINSAVYTTGIANPDTKLFQLVQVMKSAYVNYGEQIHSSKTVKTAGLFGYFHPTLLQFKCTFTYSLLHVYLSSLSCVLAYRCEGKDNKVNKTLMSWNWHHSEACVNHQSSDSRHHQILKFKETRSSYVWKHQTSNV